MDKPPSLPEQNQPENAEPPLTDEDTQPTRTQSDTQPKRPGVIPPPPGARPAPTVIRWRYRRRSKRDGWWAALGIALLLSLIIALVAFIVLLIYTPEYFDPYIPGRLATRTAEAQQVQATRTAEAQQAQATADTLATRENALIATQQQAANNAAATSTAIIDQDNRRATQSALDAQGTSSALVQTATSAALAFDATRTAVALESQGTAAAATLDAVSFQFTRTAAAQVARATSAPSNVTVQAPPGEIVQRQGNEPPSTPLATLNTSRFNVLFSDSFQTTLDPAWAVSGDWQTDDGAAFATTCGTSLLVGDEQWQQFVIELVVDNPGAQFAVLAGYGDGGRLFINFGLGGSVWWLVDGEDAITDETAANVYTPSASNQVRVVVDERVVSVFVDGVLAAERLLPKPVRGGVGLYTCPANGNIPRFETFRVVRLVS